MSSMTPKQRWRAVLSGEKPDRTPCDYWGTPEVTSRLLLELGCKSEKELWETLGIDKCIHLAPSHPAAKEDTWHIQSQFSVWHVGTRSVRYGDDLGSYEEDAFCPLAGAKTSSHIEEFDWPKAEDWDMSGLRGRCLEWSDYPILSGTYEPFYLYCRMRGMEQALEDLVANPAIVEASLERIYMIHEALIRRILAEVGDLIDLVYVAEDLGTQKSLLIGPAAFRRFLKPWMGRLIQLIHSHGVKVFHHDDGAIRPLIPDLIEIGIDLLNPIQWRCRGMERADLAKDFGSRLVFHGGVDNQLTLPFCSRDQVRQEVSENIRLFQDCRGYIVAPCHNIQPNTPTQNILALYEAVHDFGSLA
jgi:uroporphyrinogen decarboxylase